MGQIFLNADLKKSVFGCLEAEMSPVIIQT